LPSTSVEGERRPPYLHREMLGSTMDRASLFEQKQTALSTRQVTQKLNRRYDNKCQSNRDQRRRKIKPHTL
jgi:hypothetical protein